MNSNIVSVETLQEVSDFMNTKYKNSINSGFQSIIDVYNRLSQNGILSSNEIDEITREISKKLTEYSNTYDDLLNDFNREMNNNIEVISAHSSKTVSNLNDSNN